MTLEERTAFHKNLYETSIQFAITCDEETLVENNNKVAGRFFITTTLPDKEATQIEVMFTTEYKDGKLFRAWEVTFPNWLEMPELAIHA